MHRFPAFLVTLLVAGVTPRSACAQLEVLSPSIMERSVSSGGSYAVNVILRNAGNAPQGARVYLEDYRFFADGRSLFERAGSHGRSNAGWIAIPKSQLVLAPGETMQLALSVAVPNDSVSRVGSYWSLLLVEPFSATAAKDAPAAGGAAAVVTRVRHAIQIVTHIAETGRHDVRIGEPRLVTSADGQREVRVEIENVGERAYRPQVSLEVLAADGRTALKQHHARGLIYPGTSIDQVFDLSALARDEYAFLLIVDTGGSDMFGARYRLKLQ